MWLLAQHQKPIDNVYASTTPNNVLGKSTNLIFPVALSTT